MRKSFEKAINNAIDEINKHSVSESSDLTIAHLRKIQNIFNTAYARSLMIENAYAGDPSELNSRRLERSRINMRDCAGAMAHANFMTSGMLLEQSFPMTNPDGRCELQKLRR